MWGYTPARGGGGWFACALFVVRVSPAPDREGGHARFTRAELQPTRGIQPKARDFTDNTREPLAAQPFLHCWKHVAVIPCLAIDDAIWMQTDARKRRREELSAA